MARKANVGLILAIVFSIILLAVIGALSFLYYKKDKRSNLMREQE
jgi:hypothetical protein